MIRNRRGGSQEQELLDACGARSVTDMIPVSPRTALDIPSCINLRPLPLGGGVLIHDGNPS